MPSIMTSLNNNVKQEIKRLKIHELNGWKYQINVNDYDNIVISFFSLSPQRMPGDCTGSVLVYLPVICTVKISVHVNKYI